MEAVLRQWGNSVAVRLPSTILKEVALTKDNAIDITAEQGKIVLTPKRHQKYDLAALVHRITKGNRHETIDSGDAVGREVF